MEREERARMLVEILGDRDARADDRDDAATYLGLYPFPFVAEALGRVASSEDEDIVLVETAGESLGEVWAALDSVQPEVMSALRRAGRKEVEAVLRGRAPHLLT